jgi:hypothetical protein
MGEEGIGGFDSREILCLAPPFGWKDPILKSVYLALLTIKNTEDVKELYFHQFNAYTFLQQIPL